MTIQGLLYIALVFVLVLGCAFPLGSYMAAIFEGRVKFLAPLENGFYRLAGVDPKRAMRWQDYAVTLLLLSVIHFFLLYAILRLQYYLPMYLLSVSYHWLSKFSLVGTRFALLGSICFSGFA